jgi:hypothetical protein
MINRTIRIAAFCAAVLVAALVIHAWLASRDEQQRLKITLAAQKQLLDAAHARERARETALNETLTQIEKLKRTTQTPKQILRDLPKYLPLPQPITFASPESAAPHAAQQGTGVLAGSGASTASRAPESDRSGTRLEESRGGPDTTMIAKRGASLPQAVPQAGGPRRQDFSVPAPPCSSTGDCSAQIPNVDLKPLYDFVQDCRACQAQLAAARQDSADDRSKIAALTLERNAAVTASKGGSFWRRLRRNTLWFVAGAGLGAAAGYAATR